MTAEDRSRRDGAAALESTVELDRFLAAGMRHLPLGQARVRAGRAT